MPASSPSPFDVPALLAQGMGPQLHWFPQDISAERLAAVLVGMANCSGGKVLVGITPRSAHVQGVDDPAHTLDLIFQAALLADPPLVLPMPRLQNVQGAPVVVIMVPAGLPSVYSLEGRYLGREGTQTNPLPARRLRQLLLERGVIQFEAQIPPQATYTDLDPDKIAEYVQILDLPLVESHAEILLRRGCLRYEGPALPGEAPLEPSRLRPTYAALLLFGRHPQQWLPNATILAARFGGITFADRFLKLDITGTLPDQLRQAEAFGRENLRRVVRMVGLAHQETTEVPLEAVRELLVNAVAHRDYNLQGDNIHLNLFADRIEVQSPGSLPGPVTLDNLLEARFSRNAILVQVLSDMGFVERLGYGLDRVVQVMHLNGLRQPRFEEVAGSFRVTLYNDLAPQPAVFIPGGTNQAGPRPAEELTAVDLAPYRALNLNPRQEMALAHLIRYHRITNREFQDLCPDVHPETLRRDLADLAARRVVLKVGDKRATYYILK